MAPAERTTRIEANGIPIHVVRVGSGPPVLVLHGGPQLGHAYLRPGLDTLASDVELVYFDQRGSGETPVGDLTRLSARDHVDDLDALITTLGGDPSALLGHSAGADLAVLYAEAHPERVRALVLLMPGPPFTEELGQQLESAYMGAIRPEDGAAMAEIERSAAFARREPEAIEAYTRHQYVPFFRERESALAFRYGITPISAANVLGSEARWLRDFTELDPLGRLGSITAPALILRADHDPIPAAFAEQLEAGIPNARLVTLEDSSHFAYHEDPELVRDTVVPFLREHLRS